MPSLSRALIKRKSSEETHANESCLMRIKVFDGFDAKFRFESDFKKRNYSPAREINLEFFYKEGFRCFEMFKFNGWEFFLNLKETIYPILIREFFSKLRINQATLESNILIRGRQAILSKGLLSEVLKCPNTGICLDLANDIITESYHKGEFIEELVGRESSVCQVGLLGVDDRILFHIVDKVVMPKERGKVKRGGPYVRKSARLHKEKEKVSEKLVNLEEEEASSHTKKETLLSEEIVPREPEKSVPLSLSVETISQKELPKIEIPTTESPTLPELLKDPMKEHSIFCLLQETLRSSTFAHDTMVLNNNLLKHILESIQATNGLLTSIQSLMQKHTAKASITEPVLPLRITPQIEDVD
ncbi:glutamic acid-rich protein-like [Senna tora]|uniref:Glutamic acid-rich protein-like n=1 Tax=Senna tora TaxID=362788 RepID=A0A834TH78_9FABA|nr:glutamic acid-rich protein-like [Senna tora]